MKKTLSILLVLAMLLCLCACGGAGTGAEQSSAALGTYTLYAMEYDEDTVLLASELFEGENYITLKDGGKAEMCMEGETSSLAWKLDGTKLTVTADDGDIDGSLQDGILTLVFDGSELYFVQPGADTSRLKAVTLEQMLNGYAEDPDAPEQPETEAPAEETELQAMWNGWYYGCQDVNGCEGGWEFANGMTFDVAMYVELDADGTGSFGIFDPYSEMAEGPNNNRFTTIQCHADENYLYGDSGTEFGYDIDPSNWRIVHNLSNPKMLNVNSYYVDADGNKMAYDYYFLPWGERWEGESMAAFMPHLQDYLAKLDEGWTDPFGGLSDPMGTGKGGSQTAQAPSGGDTGGQSALLGSNPAALDVNDRGIVTIYYPADQFRYDDDYGKLKNSDTGVGILIDPMLGATNLAELKASYEANNSDEDDYSLVETTVNGCKALILKYSDWLGATMRVDIDFGGNHDGWYGISFAVSGDSLKDCDTDLIWAIIESMELVK